MDSVAPYSKTARNRQKWHFKVKKPLLESSKEKKSEKEQEKVQALSIFGEKDPQETLWKRQVRRKPREEWRSKC